MLCCHIGLLFGKRLDTILLRHQIRKYPDSPLVIGFVADLFVSTLENGFRKKKKNPDLLPNSRDAGGRKEKAADSKISGYVWTEPEKNICEHTIVCVKIIEEGKEYVLLEAVAIQDA